MILFKYSSVQNDENWIGSVAYIDIYTGYILLSFVHITVDIFLEQILLVKFP